MKKYEVTGMSCAACVARVEQAVSKVPGVTSCSVSLLMNSMGVEGQASDEDIIKAVTNAGYKAKPKNDSDMSASGNIRESSDPENGEITALKKRLLFSCGFLLILMYFSMGNMLFGFPIPKLFKENAVALGILELLLTAVIMVINQKFFVNGFKSLGHLAPNMDTLVALGSAVSFVYSVWNLFAMTAAQASGTIASADAYKDGFYFESAAMILALITVGKTLEAHAKGKTTDALKSLMKLAPKTATVIRDGSELIVSVEQVKVGDIFVVKAGESIPADGVIIEGITAVDEAALTGESIPVDKNPGDEVSTATMNLSGYIKCRAERVGNDTTLAQIIEMVSDAAATKAPIAKIADKVAGVFVPCVLGVAIISFIVWMIAGADVKTAISFACSVLVISCPCSLGLATPVAIMVGNGVGAKNGILYKSAASLEGTGKIQIAAFDKTGTVTCGLPQVTDVEVVTDESELLQIAYALERKSEHPLAKAIVEYAESKNINNIEISEFAVIPGKGLQGKILEKKIFGGNLNFIKEKASIPSKIKKKMEELSYEGKTAVLFADENKLLGMIAVADVIKADAKEAIDELKNMGIHVVMITGDNNNTAKAIADQVGIENIVAEVLPDMKEEVVRELQKHGKVAMVGDGINDAPALTRADIGIAIGSGTDIAIEAAEVVLLKNELRDVPSAIRLGRATLRNIRENLFWAFFYNSISIPIAAGVLAIPLGIKLNPMIGAAAMSLSSFCVVMNALRLNLLNIYDSNKDKNVNKSAISLSIIGDGEEKTITSCSSTGDYEKKTEERKMTKTIKITGMMCPHCEARVKEALEKTEGVTEACVNHEKGTAIVDLSENVADEVLKKVVEDERYTVTEII